MDAIEKTAEIFPYFNRLKTPEELAAARLAADADKALAVIHDIFCAFCGSRSSTPVCLACQETE